MVNRFPSQRLKLGKYLSRRSELAQLIAVPRRKYTDGRSARVVPDLDDVGLVVAGRPMRVGGETGSLPRAGRETRASRVLD